MAERIDTLPIWGICLGAQLLAHILGGRVLPAEQPEVGWNLVDEGNASRWMLQWREQCFEPPRGATVTARNRAWPCQGFVFGRIAGIQFHPEWTSDLVQALIDDDPAGCPLTLRDAQADERFRAAHRWLARRLDDWIGGG